MRILKWVIGLLALSITALYVTGHEYILKGIRVVYFTGHTTAFIDDHIYFENDTIPASTHPQPWPFHNAFNQAKPTPRLTATHEALGTIAFLVIKKDSIWHESYAQEYDTTSQTNSFSIAKSVITAMLGKAIMEGHIKSLDQEVSDFYPQFEGSGLAVGDLASMASGLNWDESYINPFGITARAYYNDNLARAILGLKVIEPPGQSFTYLSGNTQLLGMLIEKASGKRLSRYLHQSFWQPMGFEQPALWQLDDKENKLAKAYCCIASNARDFARFGKLYKNGGNWHGTQLLDSAFIAKSIVPRFEDSPEYGYGFWLSDHLGKQIFVMRGILGQYVITIPEDDLIIVRLGHQRGERDGSSFTHDFYVYIEEVYEMLAGVN